MSNVVCIGAGQTGRGYINRFFKDDKIIFLDKNKELVKQLQETKTYTVSFGKEREPLVLDNYFAYDVDSVQAIEYLKEADLVVISVGQKNLSDVLPILQTALKDRKKGDIDILTGENGVNVKQALIQLEDDSRVHLAEAIIFCTTLKEEDSLDILSENLDYFPYDVVSLGHELPYKNMIAESNLDVLMQRKIYTYNCISAVVSYLGYYKGYEVYGEAANDPDINLCIQNIVHELNQCICREYGIDKQEQETFSNMAIRKFQNKDIIDTIERNARDVDRKLGETERILAPLVIMHKYNVTSNDLLLVAASAIYYGIKTDTLMKDPKDYFSLLPEECQNKIMNYVDALENKVSFQDIA